MMKMNMTNMRDEGSIVCNIANGNKDVPLSGKAKLLSWLNKSMKVEMSDGRVLVGSFLCTDRDANLILGSCTEYLNPQVCGFSDEPRVLGLVMVPGRHIVSIHLDNTQGNSDDQRQKKPQDMV
uniref:LSM domain-containing protein 1-A n=2 Tax=Lygus hesperus TaxID=30085 RepID=A0A146LJY8_LYGHE